MSVDPDPPSAWDESDREAFVRHQRQLSEVLQELRVALPGVQLLLGFLLTVPFNQRFGELSSSQRDVYLIALLAAVTSSACLITPAAFHRLVFHRGDRRMLIRLASRMLLLGLAALAISIVGSVWVVTDFLFGGATSIVTTAFCAALILTLWFGLGLLRRSTTDAGPPPPRPPA